MNPPAPTNPPEPTIPPTTLPPTCPPEDFKFTIDNYPCSETCRIGNPQDCQGGFSPEYIVSVTPLKNEGEFCTQTPCLSGYYKQNFNSCEPQGDGIKVAVTYTYGCDENCENCESPEFETLWTVPIGGGCHVIEYKGEEVVQPTGSFLV